MNKKKVLIFGAGAIGRGFIAPKFYLKKFSISFVDINKKLVKELKKKKNYKAAFTNKNSYKIIDVKIEDIFHLNDKFDVTKYDIIFSCVGPNQITSLSKKIKNAKSIISCENDIKSKEILKKIVKSKNVYFGIPDVITSNTAPNNLKKIDNLITVSENGILVVENNKIDFSGVIKKVTSNELIMHWDCKLFLHNAPHAILAYLGYQKNYKYIHEAMNNKIIKKIVTLSMKEISEGIIKSKMVKKNFVNYYMSKELKRFKNKLLFDPISRVAREPLRKLRSDNRIILALRLAFMSKKIPLNTLIGLKAAMNFNNKKDKESLFLQKLMKNLTEAKVLKKISGIEEKDPINILIKRINLKKILKND